MFGNVLFNLAACLTLCSVSMCHIAMISVQAGLLPDQPGPLGMLDLIIHQPPQISAGGCFAQLLSHLAVTSCVPNSLKDKVQLQNVLSAFMSTILLSVAAQLAVFSTPRGLCSICSGDFCWHGGHILL